MITIIVKQLKEKDKISEYYRQRVHEHLENKLSYHPGDPLNNEERDEIWEDICTDIDLDDVWNNISSELDIDNSSGSDPGILIKSVAALIILLFGLIPVKKGIPDSVILQPDILIEKTQKEQSSQIIIRNGKDDSKSGESKEEFISQSMDKYSDKSEGFYKIAQTGDIGPDHTVAEPIIENNEEVIMVKTQTGITAFNKDFTQAYITAERTGFVPALIPDGLGITGMFAGSDHGIRRPGDNSIYAISSDGLIDRGRISLGLITSFKNTWLLNHETFDGFTSESLNTTKFVFAPDAGVSLNYALNENWSLQADAYLYSGAGQKYLGFYNGQYGRKKITLRYSTVDLSVKYSHPMKNIFAMPSSINFIAGNYISILHNANQTMVSYFSNIETQYHKYDFGIRLGTEIEMYLTDHLSLAPGLIVTMGIPNIYKGTENIPGYLRRTRNGSEGLRIAIYYH